jgi:tetratricopeptide (TPR) repeat protein
LWSQGYEEYQKKNYERAEELYLSSNNADPEYAPAVNSLGNIALQRGQSQRAEQYFRQASKLDANYAPAAYNLVLALNAQHRAQEAKAQFKRATEVNPNYALKSQVASTLDVPPSTAAAPNHAPKPQVFMQLE